MKTSVLSFSALTLLLSGLTHGCLQYSAWQDIGTNDLSATLTDNGQEVCWFGPGNPGSDGAYRFTCIAANYAAIAYNNGALVTYANPHGNFQFEPSQGGQGGTTLFYANIYGC